MKILQYPVTLGLFLVLSMTTKAEVQSFKTWKAQQVRQAQAYVRKVKTRAPNEVNSENLYRALLRLEMSKELTVNDYFVMYLSNHPDGKKAFQSAVKKLSPMELSSLLWALRPHFEMTESSTASGGKSHSKSNN